jgi:hypothetical protein
MLSFVVVVGVGEQRVDNMDMFLEAPVQDVRICCLGSDASCSEEPLHALLLHSSTAFVYGSPIGPLVTGDNDNR